jgi:hypothetical protein
MNSVRTYLIKLAAADDGLPGLKELSESTGIDFPGDKPEDRRARYSLMDLGEKGPLMSREAVNAYLRKNTPKYTPKSDWIGRGALIGAVGLPLFLKHRELRRMANSAKPNQNTLKQVLQLAGMGAIGGAGVGAYKRYTSQQETTEKAIDEYNKLRLSKMYK